MRAVYTNVSSFGHRRVQLEKLAIGIILAFIGGVFFLAYNNPKGYEVFMLKVKKWLTDTWGCLCIFGAGIHFTLWQFDLTYPKKNPLNYIIPNFGYIWGTALLFVFLYLVFSGIGKLLGELKAQDS